MITPTMGRPSKEAIYDALTGESDGDWRNNILGNADPKTVASIREKLSKLAGLHTDREMETVLTTEGVLNRGPSAPGLVKSSMREYVARAPQPMHEIGMRLFGIPDDMVDRLTTAFEAGEIPVDVVDAVVNQQEAIHSLHPDRYPFEDTAYDVVSAGLVRAGFDTTKIWQGVETDLVNRKRADLALMYGYASPTGNLTGLLAHYALTMYDNEKLNQSRK